MISVAFTYMKNPIKLREEKPTAIIIENKFTYRNILSSFINNNEEEYFTFAQDFNPFEFYKKGCFILDPINLDLDNKKANTKSNEFLANNINDIYQEDLSQINSEMLSLADKLMIDSSFEISYDNYELDAASLIKLLGFHLSFDNQSAVDRLISYILILSKFLKYDIFVISNLYIYFTLEEIKMIYETLKLNHIIILVLEQSQPNLVSKYENVYILDNDLCVIDK